MADYGTDDTAPELTLFDIAWEDVLFAKLLPLLSLADLFNLRCCSRLSKQLVDGGLRSRRIVNLSGNNSRSVHRAFRVLSRKCRNVRTANLAKCSWLSDGLLAEFLRANTKIRRVNLSDCVNVTPVGLQPIIIECKQLQELKLARCSWLTIGAIEALTLHHSAPGAHGIVELDISHCVGLNERCISIFLLNMRQLRTLAVAYIPAVTDNLLYSIAKNAKAMRHLNIIGCQLTTDRGVGWVLVVKIWVFGKVVPNLMKMLHPRMCKDRSNVVPYAGKKLRKLLSSIIFYIQTSMSYRFS